MALEALDQDLPLHALIEPPGIALALSSPIVELALRTLNSTAFDPQTR